MPNNKSNIINIIDSEGNVIDTVGTTIPTLTTTTFNSSILKSTFDIIQRIANEYVGDLYQHHVTSHQEECDLEPIELLELRKDALSPVYRTYMIRHIDPENSATSPVPGIYAVPIVTRYNPKRRQMAYMNYRSVDSTMVNRLNQVTESTVSETHFGSDKQPILYLTDSLPGGYVLQHMYNKAMNPANFNAEYGRQFARSKLDGTLDERLYELEGYRLYHTLNSLDAMRLNPDIFELIVNGAQTTSIDEFVILSTTAFQYADLCAQGLPRTTVMVGYEDYIKAITLLTTHYPHMVEWERYDNRNK